MNETRNIPSAAASDTNRHAEKPPPGAPRLRHRLPPKPHAGSLDRSRSRHCGYQSHVAIQSRLAPVHQPRRVKLKRVAFRGKCQFGGAQGPKAAWPGLPNPTPGTARAARLPRAGDHPAEPPKLASTRHAGDAPGPAAAAGDGARTSRSGRRSEYHPLAPPTAGRRRDLANRRLTCPYLSRRSRRTTWA